ncbi:iron ABC transporter permease [Clostridia bacterium OttesenSCG-928-O13]|nr:iron ABC transporter permease [Clostridia bacterium OttesenSCG-928-O13]
MKGSATRVALVCALLAVGLVASILAAISFGTSDLPVRTAYEVLKDVLLNGGAGEAAGQYTRAQYQIVWNIRLPRVLFGLVCGMGLSLCGAVMQSLVMNPIADPYVLGISSGASAGAAWALLMPLPYFVGQYQVTVTAMLGALIASALVYTMAKAGGGGQIRGVTLLLSGTAVNAVMSAITSLLIFLAKSPESIAAVYNWQMGSIAAAQWPTLSLPLLCTGVGLVFFCLCAGRLNMMMLGDEDAMSMGLNVRRFRLLMFSLCSLVVAALVSVTGIIGFVGLVVPHMVRFMTGTSNNRVVIPLSALMGGIFLIWADAASRGLFGRAELPLGIITAFVGAPFFLYLMVRRRGMGGTE